MGSQVLDRHRALRCQGFLTGWLAHGRAASTPKRKAGALAFLPGGVSGLSWIRESKRERERARERAVPPRGCATVSSGRMRSFLRDSRSFLLPRSLKALFSPPILSPAILKTTLKTTSVHACREPAFLGSHYENTPRMFLGVSSTLHNPESRQLHNNSNTRDKERKGSLFPSLLPPLFT